MGAWLYPVTVQNFILPPIISGMGKPTDSNFLEHSYDQSGKSTLKIWRKVAVGKLKDSGNFSQQCTDG